MKSEVGDSDGIDVSITVDIGIDEGQRGRTVEVVAVGMNEGCAVEMEVGCIEGDTCTTVGVIVGEDGSADAGDLLVLSMEGNEDNGETVGAYDGAYIGNAFLVGLLLGWYDGFPSGATLGRREGVRLGLRDGCSVGCSDGRTCGLQLGCLVGHENG